MWRVCEACDINASDVSLDEWYYSDSRDSPLSDTMMIQCNEFYYDSLMGVLLGYIVVPAPFHYR